MRQLKLPHFSTFRLPLPHVQQRYRLESLVPLVCGGTTLMSGPIKDETHRWAVAKTRKVSVTSARRSVTHIVRGPASHGTAAARTRSVAQQDLTPEIRRPCTAYTVDSKQGSRDVRRRGRYAVSCIYTLVGNQELGCKGKKLPASYRKLSFLSRLSLAPRT